LSANRQPLPPETPTRRLVIGVGNGYRRDDGVGVKAARRLRESRADLTVVEASGEGGALLSLWRPVDQVVLIDAVRAGSQPGKVHRFDAHRQSIPSDFFSYSTHQFSVAEAVEMARALGTLPRRLIVYGIEGKCFAGGTGLSPEVDASVQNVLERIAGEFQSGVMIRETEEAHA